MHIKKLLSVVFAGAATLAVSAAACAAPSSNRYLVQFAPGKTNNGKAALKAAGGVIKKDLGRYDAVAVELSAAGAASIKSDPNVKFVEVDEVRYPISAVRSVASGADSGVASATHPAQVVPYGITMVQAEGYTGNPGSGIKVCVIDSGYDALHEDKITSNVSGTDDVPGAGKWSSDGSGHGTHTSGTISALNNGVGVIGVFPDVPMHIVRVFGKDGLWAYSSDLINAVDDCVSRGAKVINMSLGGERPGQLENAAFLRAEKSGVLSIAAAGNGGDGRSCDMFADPGHPERQACKMHYPAGYDSVMSVAAVDAKRTVANFSQINSKVEIAAPGVAVLSTVPTGSMMDVTLNAGGTTTKVVPMDNFPIPTSPVSGAIKDCGLGTSAAECGDATGSVCLIERGAVSFAQKAVACEQAGGKAAVVFQKAGESGPVLGTLGSTQVTIPVVGTTRDVGLALRTTALGTPATVSFVRSGYDYDYLDGTSMATPHVAGVAALIWSTHPQCGPQQIRAAMNATAIDLGTPGRDKYYGNGLVQTKAASKYLDMNPCSGY